MGTEKTVSVTTLLLLVILSALLGSILTKLYYEMQLSDLQSEKIKTERANDQLIVERMMLREDLDDAEKRAEKARQGVYARNPAAKAWADVPVPDELADGVRRAATRANAAATSPDPRASR